MSDGLARAAAGGRVAASGNGATGSIQITGRVLRGYRDMFGLTDDEIRNARLLDCPAGVSSFGAQVRLRGGSVTSVDSVYTRPVDAIEQAVQEGIAATPAFAAQTIRDTLDWDSIGSVRALVALWETAADLFLTDYAPDDASGRYVAASLPRLPFPDGSFDLAVSGFLLFFYSDVLGLDDHVAALDELTRVATEVRVHPLVDSRGLPSPHLDRAREILDSRGIDTALVPATGSDLLAADHTLSLRRR